MARNGAVIAALTKATREKVPLHYHMQALNRDDSVLNSLTHAQGDLTIFTLDPDGVSDKANNWKDVGSQYL